MSGIRCKGLSAAVRVAPMSSVHHVLSLSGSHFLQPAEVQQWLVDRPPGEGRLWNRIHPESSEAWEHPAAAGAEERTLPRVSRGDGDAGVGVGVGGSEGFVQREVPKPKVIISEGGGWKGDEMSLCRGVGWAKSSRGAGAGGGIRVGERQADSQWCSWITSMAVHLLILLFILSSDAATCKRILMPYVTSFCFHHQLTTLCWD